MLAVVAMQGDRLERVEQDRAELRDAICWLAASSERHAALLRRLLAVEERLAATFRELRVTLEYQNERTARQEQRADRRGQRLEQDDTRLADAEEPPQWPERELLPVRSDVGSLRVTARGMAEADAVAALVRAREQNGFAVPDIPTRLALDSALGPVTEALDRGGEGARNWSKSSVRCSRVRFAPGCARSPLRLSARDSLVPVSSRRCSPPSLGSAYTGKQSGPFERSGWVCSRGAVGTLPRRSGA